MVIGTIRRSQLLNHLKAQAMLTYRMTNNDLKQGRLDALEVIAIDAGLTEHYDEYIAELNRRFSVEVE